MSMPVAQCRDAVLHYEDTGGDGPPLILAHGYGLDSSMFAGQRDLAPRWRVIAWDARGHGRTTDDGRPFTYWDLVDDLLQLMDTLGIETASIGGVSQGGFIALRAALAAPERVESLVLFDTEAGGCSAEDLASYRQMFDELAELGPVDELVVPLARQIVGDLPAADDWARRWGATGVPLGPAVECLLGRDDVIDRLDQIVVPALLLRGERDTSIPLSRMNILHEGLVSATEIHFIPGAGHSPPMTHPRETNVVLSAFLAGLVEAG
jgi:pimeloyl-ACP methyl ester carboxylesterase